MTAKLTKHPTIFFSLNSGKTTASLYNCLVHSDCIPFISIPIFIIHLVESFTPLIQAMKKMVLKLELNDIKDKQKAIKAVSILQGIDSIGIDMKAQTMTVIGSVDPVSVVTKLRKFWHTDVVSIGPEPKQEEPKKEETKNEEAKEEKKDDKKEEAKEEPQKEDNKEETKEEEPKKVIAKKEPHEEMAPESVNPYKIYYNPPMHYYNPHTTTQYYYVPTAQENPNLCNIL